MHILPPFLLLTSLSSTLASPLLLLPMDATIHAMIEKGGHFSVNTTTSCPADPVEALEKLVFESTIDEFETAREAALKGEGDQCLDWSSDGCTHSPDKPFWCNLKPSCQRHDFAQINFKHLHVWNTSNKKRVEKRFEQDMMDVCTPKKWFRKWPCKAAAGTYATAVKIWPNNKAVDPDA